MLIFARFVVHQRSLERPFSRERGEMKTRAHKEQSSRLKAPGAARGIP